MDLRKVVGHRPLLRCGAGVIVEDNEGKILLQLRQDNGCWGMPGGSVELDEVSNIDIVFSCNHYSGELRIDEEESRELKFFNIKELPSNILQPQQKAIQVYVDYKTSL